MDRSEEGTRSSGGRVRYDEGRALSAGFLWFPAWWAAGVSALIWPIVAAPMALRLLRRRVARAPRGWWLWLCFLYWMLGSATQIDQSARGIPFAFRAVTYLAATVMFLYVYSSPREHLTDRRVVTALAGFWGILTIGGLLGTFAPHLEFRSPMESILPTRIASHPFVRELIHPATAQITTFLGYEAPRPKAPLEYANDWGSAFALTLPFVPLAWRLWDRPLRRYLLGALVPLSVIPVVTSMNRGLWLSLLVGVAYVGSRFARRGPLGMAGWVLILLTAAALVWLSPLRGMVATRLATPHSNQGRVTLYTESLRDVARSPLLGYGAPQPSEINPDLPPVGTQGQLWLVLVSHGIPGAVFYVGWYLVAWWRTRRGDDPVMFWSNVSLLLAIVQLPFYGQIPAQIQIVMVAAALALRASRDAGIAPGSPRPVHTSPAL